MISFLKENKGIIQIFEVSKGDLSKGDNVIKLSNFQAYLMHNLPINLQYISHDGPIWQITWAHPKFGNILASCSFDKKVSTLYSSY